MTKKQKDKAFIEKCKSIGISTGKSGVPVCDSCHKPISEHELKLMKLIQMATVEKPRHDESAEESFAA